MSGYAWALRRDLALGLRHPGETLLVIAFFILVASLFPFGVGAEPQLLQRIGPGVIWVCALLALEYGLPVDALGTLALSLLLGTPILSLLGAACTALALGARGGGVLLALLALPLFVPVLIFGAGAVEAKASGLPAGAHLSLLGAGLILSAMALPFAAAAAVRIALD